MDPIAHTLLGATLAETGLRKKTAFATLTLLIGVNLPDIDIIAAFDGRDSSLWFRRGWSHGVLAMVVLPWILAGAMMGLDKLWRKIPARSGTKRQTPPISFRSILLLSFLGVWSHPVLDWFNTYGIRLLMPFDGRWFYGDTLFIVDPWVWLILGSTVVLARSSSWISIGGWLLLGSALTLLVLQTDMVPRSAKILWSAALITLLVARNQQWIRPPFTRVAWICLILFFFYAGSMLAGSRIASRHVKEQLSKEGIEIQKIMAAPLPARFFLREGVAASDTHYYLFRLNWSNPQSFELASQPIPKTPPEGITSVVLQDPNIRGLRNWLRFPHYELTRQKDDWCVSIRDLRFSSPDQEEGLGVEKVCIDEQMQPFLPE